MADGEVGYMGITMQDVTDQITQMLGIPGGVYVFEVAEGSAAEQAGIRRGDVIVKFDGQKISTRKELKKLVEYYKAGETVSVTGKRFVDGESEEVDLEITLGSQPEGQ